jgi:high-affinity nickel-transport protein
MLKGENRQLRYSWKKYALCVLLLHLAGVGLLIWSWPDYPALLGFGVLAYTLGLRHAFDADHIAAIDNTVRKLAQQRTNPTGVGFFFSLGHSSVVGLMTVVVALAVTWAQTNLPALEHTGGLIGTSVSGVFLILIGMLNLIVLIQIFHIFLKMRRERHDDEQLERLLNSRGFVARLLNPLFKLVNRSWHVFPLGFLFGLGFDTASEVALLAIAAGASQSSLPVVAIMALPLLFAAGMSLLDTADGIFMTSAYQWAFRTPLRKIYYNMSVTALSVAAALVIGAVELLQLLAPKLALEGRFWDWVQELDFGSLGYLLVGMFVLAWAISYGIWKLLRIEQRWNSLDSR